MTTGPPPRLIAGRYRLLDRLGAGGMGTVWRAYDTVLMVDVAAKEISLPSTPTPAIREMRITGAIREARVVARLRACPEVVAVHDAVEHDGAPWIIMDLIEPSESLAGRVRRTGALDPAHAARVGVAVLEALTAAHAEGILHRDVTPANILLAGDGDVLLTDFGLARHIADPDPTGAVPAGTPLYLAPERLQRQPASTASDLYGLGATLYYALHGRAPYPDGPGGRPPISPERAGSLMPVLVGLLNPDPTGRATAATVRPLLVAAVSGRRPAPRWAGPLSPAFLLGAVILALLVALLAVSVLAVLAFGRTTAARAAAPALPVMASPTRAAAVPAANVVPGGYRGRWVGDVTQGPLRYAALVVISGGPLHGIVGASTFPAFPCAGRLTLETVGGNGITLAEHINPADGPTCLDSPIQLTLTGTAMRYRVAAQPGLWSAATGILRHP